MTILSTQQGYVVINGTRARTFHVSPFVDRKTCLKQAVDYSYDDSTPLIDLFEMDWVCILMEV